METDVLNDLEQFGFDNLIKDPVEEDETLKNTEVNEEDVEDVENTSEEQEETETIEGYVDGSPEPVPVEFTLLTDTVDFDTPLNDLGFASVAICISLFVMFLVVAWRFDK